MLGGHFFTRWVTSALVGELVGLLFDGTDESVASNFLFDSVTTRSIHVDSRYMLWTMAEVNGPSICWRRCPSRLKYRRVPHLRSNLLLPFLRSRRGDN